jgi:hypothetical protein
LRRARVAEQFGKVVGYCALSDQYRILWAIKMSRTSGLARMTFLLGNSSSALIAPELVSQFLQQKWQFRVIGEYNKLPRIAKTPPHERI